MAFIQAGFELALNQLTDDTTGINKVSVFFSDSTETASQTITWAAAAGNSTSASVGASVDLVFDVAAGKVLTAAVLYHDTTSVATYVFPTPYSFTNAGTFTLTALTISLS